MPYIILQITVAAGAIFTFMNYDRLKKMEKTLNKIQDQLNPPDVPKPWADSDPPIENIANEFTPVRPRFRVVIPFSYLAPATLLAVSGIRMTLSSKYQLYVDITYVTLG